MKVVCVKDTDGARRFRYIKLGTEYELVKETRDNYHIKLNVMDGVTVNRTKMYSKSCFKKVKENEIEVQLDQIRKEIYNEI